MRCDVLAYFTYAATSLFPVPPCTRRGSNHLPRSEKGRVVAGRAAGGQEKAEKEKYDKAAYMPRSGLVGRQEETMDERNEGDKVGVMSYTTLILMR